VSDRLSTNFSVHEVFGDHEPTTFQTFLARELAERCLEPIRALMQCPIYVSDGFRSFERHKELDARGYQPYILTDHSFMDSWQPLGVGAVDILKLVRTRYGNLQRRAFTEAEYDDITELLGVENPLPYGQLIWYRKRGHLHISNPRSLVFSEAFVEHAGFPRRSATYIKEG